MEDLFFIQNGVRRRAKEITCSCGTTFLTRINSSQTFCSKQCSYQNKKTWVSVNCLECGQAFERSKYKVENASKHSVHFCSRSCKDKAQSLKGSCDIIRPNHYGTGNGKGSYRRIAFKTFEPVCIRCGYNKYPDILQVHHKDKNRDNNELQNLEVLCPTCHTEFHYLDESGPFTKGV